MKKKKKNIIRKATAQETRIKVLENMLSAERKKNEQLTMAAAEKIDKLTKTAKQLSKSAVSMTTYINVLQRVIARHVIIENAITMDDVIDKQTFLLIYFNEQTLGAETGYKKKSKDVDVNIQINKKWFVKDDVALAVREKEGDNEK